MTDSNKKKRKTNMDKAKKKKSKVAYKKITITLPEEAVEKLTEIAKEENRTRSNTIWWLIEKSKN